MLRKAMSWLKRIGPQDPSVNNDTYTADLFSKEEWDRQYTNGRWDYLRTIGEAAHYGIILSYLYAIGHAYRILDIGCGEGLLHAMLDPQRYGRYVGIDVSSEAIGRLSHRLNAKTVFVSADARTYNVDNGEQFDAIIFNECLYYFEDPLGVSQRYTQHLAPNGVLIVSMFAEKQTQWIWQMLDSVYHVEDEVQVTNRSGIAWTIKLLRLES